MNFSLKFWKFPAAFVFSLFLLPAVTPAQHYKQTNLVSDQVGMALVQDPSLVNPWGLTRSSRSPWWVSNNGTGTSTLYTGAGAIIPINGNGIVTIPPPTKSPAGTVSTPTGVVFNGSSDFVLSNGKSAVFIFVTEDGTISGWNGGPAALIAKDNLEPGSANGPVYKGATIAETNGKRYLYVTNFRAGRVEVYDATFKPIHLSGEAFDPDGDGDHDADDRGAERIPRGFAPFNIQNIGGSLFVTYAKQDSARHDDVAGAGLGFVEIFSPSGKHIGHLEHGSWFSSPWGVVWTTRDFGAFANAILVGNFGSGQIAAFNGFTHKFMGLVKNADDSVMSIDGLWSLTFGNDANAGPANTLFFSAGPGGEQHGLFGTLTPLDGLDGSVE